MWIVTCLSLSLTLERDSPTSLLSCASFTSNTMGVRTGFKTTTSSTCKDCDFKMIFNNNLNFEQFIQWHCHLGRLFHTGEILEPAGAAHVVERATSLARNFLSRGPHLRCTSIEEMDSVILWATYRISTKSLCVNLPTSIYHMVVWPGEDLDSRWSKG